jgi:hypothetical protein
VTPCLVEVLKFLRLFRGTCCLHLQGSLLYNVGGGTTFLENKLNVLQTTRRHISWDIYLYSLCRENIRSHFLTSVYKTPSELDSHADGVWYRSGTSCWTEAFSYSHTPLQINFQVKLCHDSFLIPIHHSNYYTLSHSTLYNLSFWFEIIKWMKKYLYVHFQRRHQTVADLSSVWFTKGETLGLLLALPDVQ